MGTSLRRRCTCGERYDRFRSGLTFASVKQLMRAGEDPSTWRNKSRRAVLGYWRQLKIERWEEIHRHCPATVDVAVSGAAISFASHAGAAAYARARARLERRPIRVEVRAGDSVIAAWRGDWHGRVRPEAIPDAPIDLGPADPETTEEIPF